VEFRQAGSHGVVWQHAVVFLRFYWLPLVVDATGAMEIFMLPREGATEDGGDPGGAPLKREAGL